MKKQDIWALVIASAAGYLSAATMILGIILMPKMGFGRDAIVSFWGAVGGAAITVFFATELDRRRSAGEEKTERAEVAQALRNVIAKIDQLERILKLYVDNDVDNGADVRGLARIADAACKTYGVFVYQAFRHGKHFGFSERVALNVSHTLTQNYSNECARFDAEGYEYYKITFQENIRPISDELRSVADEFGVTSQHLPHSR